MWQKRPFTAAGVLLTIVGIVVLFLGRKPGFDHALLFTFPLCGLIWEWPPSASDASELLQFAAMLGHWPMIGWWIDRRRSRRASWPNDIAAAQ